MQNSTESGGTGGSINAEMTNTESANLLSSSNTKPNLLTLLNNVFALVFVIIITYLCFSNGATLFSFHPVLMSIGWLLVMGTAINAISTGNLATEWMPVRLKSTRHWILQVAAFIIIGTGSIVIIANKIIHEKEHFKSLHSLFGLMTALFVTSTGLGGVGVLYRMNVAAYISPSLVKLLHIAFGVVTYAIGCITISLGLFSTWWSFGEGTRYFCLMILWIVFVMTSIKPAFNVRFMLNQRRP